MMTLRSVLAFLCITALLGVPLRTEAQRLDVDLSVGPSINWLEDAQVLGFNPEDPGMPIDTSALGQFEEFPATVGVQAGLTLGMRGAALGPSGPLLGLRLGVRYLNTGGVFNGEEFFAREEFDANYLTVALDGEVGKQFRAARLYAFGGPEVRYFLDLEDAETVNDARGGLEHLNTAVNVGAGLRLRLGGYSLGPEIRYSFGLSDVSERQVEVEGGTVNLARGLQLNTFLLGLVFGQ